MISTQRLNDLISNIVTEVQSINTSIDRKQNEIRSLAISKVEKEAQVSLLRSLIQTSIQHDEELDSSNSNNN